MSQNGIYNNHKKIADRKRDLKTKKKCWNKTTVY